jgi:mannose-6-phosphate isomerase-like protein (cupin superfamily)
MASQQAEYTKVSWDELPDYPGETSRIYSGPLRCENFAFIINRQEPGTKGTQHSHDVAEEIYVVLQGKAKMIVGDQELDANPLDAFRVAPGVEHSTSNPYDEDCLWLVIGAPADEFIAWDPVAYGPGGGLDASGS